MDTDQLPIDVEPGDDEHPQQAEMPFAMVLGAPLTELPKDLYIPPDALEVFLEAFEGPLDLLLYLIKRQNLDILDIPIAEITRQYMEYVDLIAEAMIQADQTAEGSDPAAPRQHQYRLELAAEYLVMAAMLAEIKSRMLLPRPVEEGDEDDPRADLVRRLQEYERFKKAAEDLDGLPRVGRDTFPAEAPSPDTRVQRVPPLVELRELLRAMAAVMARAEMFTHHQVQREPLSVRERMSQLLATIREHGFTEFTALFTVAEGRLGVVVSFMATLELLKSGLIVVVQNEEYGPIHIRAASQAA